MDIRSKVSRDAANTARLDRERAVNPADVEPGMGDFPWDKEDDDMGGFGDDDAFGGGKDTFGSSDGFGSGGSTFGSPAGGDPFGGPFGGSAGGFGGPFVGSSFGGPFGGPPGAGATQPQQKADPEEKFWEVLGKIGKGFFQFFGDLVGSFKTFDTELRVKTGRYIITTSVLMVVLGLVFSLFGLGGSYGVPFVISGLVSAGFGIPLFLFAYDQQRKGQGFSAQPAHDFSGESPSFDDFSSDDSGYSAFSEDEDTEFDMFPEDDEEESLFDSGEEPEIDFGGFSDDLDTQDSSEAMSASLSSLPDNGKMLTRSFLYEKIAPCLQEANRKFADVRTISEGSEEFDAWDAIVRSAADLVKPKGSEDIPYLIEAKEKLFSYLLVIKRVSWIKNLDAFVKEIVAACATDQETGDREENVYGKANASMDKIYVTIMKGENTTVSVKDIYRNVESDILNPKNVMPVVIGLGSNGEVVWKDFIKINSILIAGMPRSGKTWFLLSILAQMMFYMKPSELHFYILDPKEGISDLRSIRSPHVRKFVSKDEEILKELRNVVNVEGVRRKKILSDANCVNIFQYKEKNPDKELPFLYVVIDEVVTLAERMEPHTKDEFQSLLMELISQLPALGIRLFMVPHLVKNEILRKSVTDLIPCRVSVLGPPGHIEQTTGFKNFPHKLIHMGDMAMRMSNDDPIFVHAAVLAKDEDSTATVFDFLLKFWSHLEPESLKGSWHEKLSMMESQPLRVLDGGKDSVEPSVFPTKVDITLTTPAKDSGSGLGSLGKLRAQRLETSDVKDLLKGINDPDDDGDITI